MYELKVSGSYERFNTIKEILEFLSRDIISPVSYAQLPENDQYKMRVSIARQFRSTIQSRAISLFPIETLTRLNVEEQTILYGPEPIVNVWTHVPPLVVVIEQDDSVPHGEVINGQNTVWRIDPSTDITLLKSLMQHGGISLRKV